MAGGNTIQNYITDSTCSSALTMGCYVVAPDGWYSDGTYAYYIKSHYITSINYDPCAAPPPPPPPPPPSYYQVYLGYDTSAEGACNSVGYDLFYLDASTLSSTSGIWTDSGLTTRAIGFTYYSDGTIVRYANKTGTLGATADCGNPF
jgi:hypothetical protein